MASINILVDFLNHSHQFLALAQHQVSSHQFQALAQHQVSFHQFRALAQHQVSSSSQCQVILQTLLEISFE